MRRRPDASVGATSPAAIRPAQGRRAGRRSRVHRSGGSARGTGHRRRRSSDPSRGPARPQKGCTPPCRAQGAGRHQRRVRGAASVRPRGRPVGRPVGADRCPRRNQSGTRSTTSTRAPPSRRRPSRMPSANARESGARWPRASRFSARHAGSLRFNSGQCVGSRITHGHPERAASSAALALLRWQGRGRAPGRPPSRSPRAARRGRPGTGRNRRSPARRTAPRHRRRDRGRRNLAPRSRSASVGSPPHRSVVTTVPPSV
jgi:hypothetical protein